MKTRINIKSLVLGAMLAGIVALVVAAAPPGEKITWEYKTVTGSLGTAIYTGDRPPRLDANINREAPDGWEFVSVCDFGEGGSAFAVLRRPVKTK